MAAATAAFVSPRPMEEEVKGLDEEDRRVTLTLGEASFELPHNVAIVSGMVSGAVQMDNTPHTKISLNPEFMCCRGEYRIKMAGLTLRYVVEYLLLKKVSSIKKPLISADLVENGCSREESDWVETIFQLQRQDGSRIGTRMLLNLLSAANYMGIVPLLELCSAKVAAIIKGKTMDEIKNLLTPEPFVEDD